MTESGHVASTLGSIGSPEGRTDDAARAYTWSLLARLLSRPPDEALLTQLARIEVPDATADTALGRCWQTLGKAAAGAPVSDLDDEFHTLFIGVARGELVPYGSWYMTGFLMDKPLVSLREDLAGLGIQRRDGNKEPEDHAAALCETMALLAEPEEPASMEIQRRFFERHVGVWMEILFRDMQQARSADFYRAVGALGEAFIKLEATYLAMAAGVA